MIIPIDVGDVIITHEVVRSKLGLISKDRLNSEMIYNLPSGFTKAAEKILQAHADNVPLFAVSEEGKLVDDSGCEYNLHESADFARKGGEMQWYVAEADHENDRYSLVAIGGGRISRIQDWHLIQNILSSDEVPDISEYLVLRGIDSSFFEKKAVFRLASTGTVEPLN